MMHFGIIGNPLKQSFSALYFTEKFSREGIDADYRLFPLQDIREFEALCEKHNFTGLNVTLPFKEAIIPYLDGLDETAKGVGAVNVIHFTEGRRIGYNTDTRGFKESISPLLQPYHNNALILGTGGAAKAARYALKSLGVETSFVSRSADYDYTYTTLTKDIIEKHLLIVNCTPVGMYPETEACPNLPYKFITSKHLLYDVIYNPDMTLFLKRGKEQGATVCNGLGMLHKQAESAWQIWAGGIKEK